MSVSSSKFPERLSPTKLTYIDGRPATITLRKCKLVTNENNKRQEYVFDKDLITLGAMEDNDVVLEDETVSRYHCKIVLENDIYMLVDMDSTNGTYINRVRVREGFLRPDVIISLGNSEIRFAPIDEKLRVVPSEKTRYGDILGRNAKMREIYSILERISPTDTTVVIEGETGTGKEVVARTIHQQSRRRAGPFMVFDCGAVPENLIESELFGHEKGSFTGAITTRQGVFEMAHSGTVFLDELGELQLDLQPKLLRVLEQREVKRVGSARSMKVDVRVIAATNRNLEDEVRAGRFREDLFYRLSVVRIKLPPLRERKEDIPLLVKSFLKGSTFNRTREGERKVQAISRSAMDMLMEYDWPGNVRELVNVIERAVNFTEGDTIQVGDLPDHIARGRPASGSAVGALPIGADAEGSVRINAGSGSFPFPMPAVAPDATFKDAKEKWISSFEKEYILGLLRRNGMNISHAARESDIDRKYFRKLMKKYGITTGSPEQDNAEED